MRSRNLFLVGLAGVCAVALIFWWPGRESPERHVATERDPRPVHTTLGISERGHGNDYN